MVFVGGEFRLSSIFARAIGLSEVARCLPSGSFLYKSSAPDQIVQGSLVQHCTMHFFREMDGNSREGWLTAVRAATRTQHERLEKVVGLGRIVESEAQYVSVLRQFYGVWCPLEELLSETSVAKDPALEFPKRRRANRLVRDLEVLDPLFSDEQAIPKERLPWKTLGEARAIGILYVMEGSTLGGQIISRELQKKLGIERHSGGSFFHGHGQKTGEMWHSFLRWASQELGDLPEHHLEACIAAQRTFELLIEWFDTPQRYVSSTS